MAKNLWLLLKIFIFLMLVNPSVLASPIHYEIGGLFKSRTFVLGLNGKVSHESSLWGEHNKVLKGHTEESASFFSAGISNILEPSLQFFPLAIFGIGVGAFWNQSLTNSLEIKACKDTLECKGIAQWIYGKATLQARYEDAMFRAIFKKGRLTQKGASKPFYESSTVLVAPPEGTFLETWELTAAYELSSQWTGGFYGMDSILAADHSRSRLAMGFAKYTPSAWSYLLGLGYFASPVLNSTQSDYKSEIGFLMLLTATYNGAFTLL